jgi:hypothetical protein
VLDRRAPTAQLDHLGMSESPSRGPTAFACTGFGFDRARAGSTTSPPAEGRGGQQPLSQMRGVPIFGIIDVKALPISAALGQQQTAVLAVCPLPVAAAEIREKGILVCGRAPRGLRGGELDGTGVPYVCVGG